MTTTQANLEIKANQSFVDESAGTGRMVTKQDGSKVPFSEAHLRQSLHKQIEGLNNKFINLDIIISKV